jgi:transposase
VRVGMEATGYARWFERLLAELGFELWIGDPAEIKAKRVKKQKFDREDARLLRRLLQENNFPQIWVPGPENRDLRQLLWHRHRLVQMRTRIMNQLHALAMNEGYRWKRKLFSEPGRVQLEKLALGPWASRRRQELLELLDRMNPTMEDAGALLGSGWLPLRTHHFECHYKKATTTFSLMQGTAGLGLVGRLLPKTRLACNLVA